MISIIINIEQIKDDITVDFRRNNNNKGTKEEEETYNDLYDLIKYYIIGDDVENTIDEIIARMKNNDKSWR